MTRSVLERIGNFEPEAAELKSSVVSIGSPRSSRQIDAASDSYGTDHDHDHDEEDEEGEGEGKEEDPPAAAPVGEKRVSTHFEILKTTTISPASPILPQFESLPSPRQQDSRSRISIDCAADPRLIVSTESLPLPSNLGTPLISEGEFASFATEVGASTPQEESSYSARGFINSTGSHSTQSIHFSSGRDSEASATSLTSTRPTSPGTVSQHREVDESSGRLSSCQTIFPDECEDAEAKLMEKTFAHELMYNKEGQIIGGTLPALIERLTAHHSTPDAMFVSTFYLTFRLFASPPEFAEALAHRFEYISETPMVAGPVQLRVYNVFKGWLESHWRHDCDDAALPHILAFARTSLTEVLPTAAKRLIDLADKVTAVHSPLVPRLVSSIGKTNTSIAQYINPDSPVPAPIISKNQLAALKSWKMGGANVSILDFDPLELARQITIKESAIFCSILPEEFLATEWMKRSGSLAVNVRAMSTLSTDLANLVADSILQMEEPKKRALLIKQWVKIAHKCVELKNYDSLMAIICSLNLSTITRLKKTWEIVSQKTKATLEEAKKIVDVSRNYVVLRHRLQNQVPPCLPFVGIYLTDLTFVDHGNQTTRQLDTDDGSIKLINFDKHMKTAKIISELQRFQIPYRLTEVPELQTWMQDQLVRVRSGGEKSSQTYYRRSLVLEPREQLGAAPGPNSAGRPTEKGFDFLSWAHNHKDKLIATNG